jgi:hypothetical protein
MKLSFENIEKVVTWYILISSGVAIVAYFQEGDMTLTEYIYKSFKVFAGLGLGVLIFGYIVHLYLESTPDYYKKDKTDEI